MDGQFLLADFGGSYAHEIRLTDAIERGLLYPFTYYGLRDYDELDFSRLKWSAGHYDEQQLQELLNDNRERAAWVMEQVLMRVEDIRSIRALGFCVSIRHAEMMADFCREKDVPAMALSSRSSAEERSRAKADLSSGKINIIFTVDLYNEGVDIPAVDTVLFLRPTESLTVFLQQLGRGLRRSENKAR